MNILMITSEACPFAKTGGLADVLGSLPAALSKLGADARVIMPKYGTIAEHLKSSIKHLRYIFVRLGWRNQYCGIEWAEYRGVIYYFIDNEFYFKREGFYGYGDDAERFAFFNKAVLEAIPYLDFKPDILHCHDWQTGMIPVLLNARYRHLEQFVDIRTIFTIHNLQYKGVFGIDLCHELFDLEWEYFSTDKLELYGRASYLKGGLVYSDRITTVSHSYAKEIQNSFYGEQLEGLLSARKNELFGIINGIDEEEYDPSHDPFLYETYSFTHPEDKVKNKMKLQEELLLPVNKDIPVIGIISRLTSQKGFDLVKCVLHEILQEELQLIVLGTGEEMYERLFKEIKNQYRDKVSANILFDNRLAHRIYAGSDLFLMPSLFEPCGLGQIISLRYGTLPIVRETGGLKDTIQSYNELTGRGNGFSFTNYNAHDMLYTLRRALRIYREKETWKRLVAAAMTCDYSWRNSASKYIELYQQLIT